MLTDSGELSEFSPIHFLSGLPYRFRNEIGKIVNVQELVQAVNHRLMVTPDVIPSFLMDKILNGIKKMRVTAGAQKVECVIGVRKVLVSGKVMGPVR